MAESTSAETDTPTPAEAEPLAEAETVAEAVPKAQKKAPVKPASKPRRRAPAKPRPSRAKGAAKAEQKAAPRRFERAEGVGEVSPTVTVDATELLTQVGRLTEQLMRTRITLETTTAERDALAAQLAAESGKKSDSEGVVRASDAARLEAEQELGRERKKTAALEAELEDAKRRADEVKHQLNLTWNQLQAADATAVPPPPAPEERSRWRFR